MQGMDFSAYAPEGQSLIDATTVPAHRPPVMATREGDGGWTIPGPGDMPTLPGLPPGWGGGGGTTPEGPGDPNYVPPGGVDPFPTPGGGGLPSVPGLYTEADLERARKEGAAEEQSKMLKQTVIAAVVTGVVGYGLARVLP